MSADADHHALTALSPLDGRYASKVAALAAHFSEYGLIRHRVRVELAWLTALADEPAIAEVAPFSAATRRAIDEAAANFAPADAARVKAIERTTNHDVKAVEYWLKEHFAGTPRSGARGGVHPFRLHVGGHQQPGARAGAWRRRAAKSCCRRCAASLPTCAGLRTQHGALPMLAAHARPARHARRRSARKSPMCMRGSSGRSPRSSGVPLKGKINGAVGNYNAHLVAYPDVDWEKAGGRRRHRLGTRVQSLHDADRAARLHGGAVRRHRPRQHRC